MRPKTIATEFPTYDYPNDKTTREFYIYGPRRASALFPTVALAGSRAVGDNSIEWHWVLDKPASKPYLMTAVVGNYTVLEDKAWRNVPILATGRTPIPVDAAWRGFSQNAAGRRCVLAQSRRALIHG